MNKKCKEEVESKVNMMNTMWPDIVPCKRNAREGSEYCYAHDPETRLERIQKAYAKRHGLTYTAPTPPIKPNRKIVAGDGLVKRYQNGSSKSVTVYFDDDSGFIDSHLISMCDLDGKRVRIIVEVLP